MRLARLSARGRMILQADRTKMFHAAPADVRRVAQSTKQKVAGMEPPEVSEVLRGWHPRVTVAEHYFGRFGEPRL